VRGRVIPVLLEDVSLPVPFNVLHAVKLFGWDGSRAHESFKSLVGGVHAKVSERISAPQTSSSLASKRRALLIGVGSYAAESKLQSLPAALGNVDELGKVLGREACGFDVTVLRNIGKQELELALDQFFTPARPDELLLLYYSGHLLLTDPSGLHVTGRDSAAASYRSTMMSLGRIERDYLAQCQAQDIVLVFDACYGQAQAELVAASFQSTLGSGRSLVVVASEANPGANVLPFQEKHSPFTQHLLRTLDSNAADSNGDGIVTVEEITHYVTEKGAPNLPLARTWSFASSPSKIEIRQKKGHVTEELALNEEQKSFVRAFVSELGQGKIVPFLGDGIYGADKLSFFRVARALAEAAGFNGEKRQAMIATAAESLELHKEDRGEFLGALDGIFSRQAQGVEPPAVHELILEMKAPWLVVSVNYDDVLEERLTRAERPFVVVSHVLRSGDADDGMSRNKHAGKILVVRSKHHPDVLRDPTKEVELTAAHSVALRPDDCIIYKLLGAPWLRRLPFVEREELDTVVITESDHVDFLVHLRGEETGVPDQIRQMLRMGKLLFLEYNLDVWNYRLIGHLFRRSGDPEQSRPGSVCLKRTPYMLRTATSPTEELFWKRRFNPDRVPADLNTFVRAVRAALGESK
jgi:hypothetical protein